MQGDEATSAFVGEPQPVEVYHDGVWYSGELLGWRFDESGRALARVRCVVDGLRHSTWKDLSELRLPEPRTPVANQPAAGAGSTAPPSVPAVMIGRHETAAPSRPQERGRPEPPEDGDTQPHALLVGRDLRRRPPAPRPPVRRLPLPLPRPPRGTTG